MKQTVISSIMLLLLLNLYGQTRLEPADSVDNNDQDWFKENPWGLIVTTSVLSDPAFNLGYNEMFAFLDDQGIGLDKDLELMQFGFQVRQKRLLWDAVVARDAGIFSDEEFRVGGRNLTVEQAYRSFNTSLGYIVFSNAFLSIAPRVGIGIARYSVQYTFDGDTPFDFSDPNSFRIEGSPEMFHQSGFYHFAIDLFYGLQNKRRNFVFQRSRIGFQQGWKDQIWESDDARLSTVMTDRSSQLYLSFIFGFGHHLKSRS